MSSEILDNIQHFTKDTSCIRLLKKYATLLTVFLIVGFLLDIGSTALFGLLVDNFSIGDKVFFQYIYLIPRFIMNLITTAIVYQDMKRTNSYSGAILGLTIFYDEIGAAFFYYLCNVQRTLCKEHKSIVSLTPGKYRRAIS